MQGVSQLVEVSCSRNDAVTGLQCRLGNTSADAAARTVINQTLLIFASFELLFDQLGKLSFDFRGVSLRTVSSKSDLCAARSRIVHGYLVDENTRFIASNQASFPTGASLHHPLQKHPYKPFAIDHGRIGGIRLHSWEVDNNESIAAPFRVLDGEA